MGIVCNIQYCWDGIIFLSLILFVTFIICYRFVKSGMIDVDNVNAAVINNNKNNSDEVGRYQFFVKDNNIFSYVYVIDTKTGRIYLRHIFDSETGELLRTNMPEGKKIA